MNTVIYFDMAKLIGPDLLGLLLINSEIQLNPFQFHKNCP